MPMFLVALGLVLLLVLVYAGRGYWAWVSAVAAALAAWAASGIGSVPAFATGAGLALLAAVLFGLRPLRRRLVSRPLMGAVAAALPRIGDTERIALEAGTVWWDGDLFSGRPDWRKLLDFRPPGMHKREQAFLDGPTEELCAMLDDWEVFQNRDLPAPVWEFLKRERFFGMIVPEAYGGLGFSALAQSAVIVKIASRSVPAACVVMVPNSLGPGELLAHYGTETQKAHYLPRLARGEEIPCFALTEAGAGSDAANTRSTGIVCRGTFEGKEVLGLRLNWQKRYITLAPVATIVGLAFRLLDPDGLLGGDEDRGITCALVPADLSGIEIGHHHDPMGVPFPNGPIVGRDVFVPIDFVIGGRDGVGHGWRMLMESLAAGRSISLPALSVGAAQLATRVTGAYGTVREQFGLPIGRFEGIEEPLARIGGLTYLMDAARTLTCGAVDAGEKPAVLGAIVKAYLTDGMRAVINDAMDIRAGSEVCRGPRNILGRPFVGVPIAITVEGANILTRSLIIYGQGAVRCHPFVLDEMQAIQERDAERFDRAFFGHVGFFFRNGVRALWLALTGARLVRVPTTGPAARTMRSLTRYSAAFALVSDGAMATLGGGLKRREKISGRLADALAWLYLGSAALKRFHDAGAPARDRPLLEWSCRHAMAKVEEALGGALDNLPNRPAAWLLDRLVFPLGRRMRPPRDDLGRAVARSLLDGGEARLQLSSDIFVPARDEDGLGRLEAALAAVVSAQPAERKIRDAVRAGRLADASDDELATAAHAAGVIDDDELARVSEATAARDRAIQVDAFDPQTYRGLKG